MAGGGASAVQDDTVRWLVVFELPASRPESLTTVLANFQRGKYALRLLRCAALPLQVELAPN